MRKNKCQNIRFSVKYNLLHNMYKYNILEIISIYNEQSQVLTYSIFKWPIKMQFFKKKCNLFTMHKLPIHF